MRNPNSNSSEGPNSAEAAIPTAQRVDDPTSLTGLWEQVKEAFQRIFAAPYIDDPQCSKPVGIMHEDLGEYLKVAIEMRTAGWIQYGIFKNLQYFQDKYPWQFLKAKALHILSSEDGLSVIQNEHWTHNDINGTAILAFFDSSYQSEKILDAVIKELNNPTDDEDHQFYQSYRDALATFLQRGLNFLLSYGSEQQSALSVVDVEYAAVVTPPESPKLNGGGTKKQWLMDAGEATLIADETRRTHKPHHSMSNASNKYLLSLDPFLRNQMVKLYAEYETKHYMPRGTQALLALVKLTNLPAIMIVDLMEEMIAFDESRIPKGKVTKHRKKQKVALNDNQIKACNFVWKYLVEDQDPEQNERVPMGNRQVLLQDVLGGCSVEMNDPEILWRPSLSDANKIKRLLRNYFLHHWFYQKTGVYLISGFRPRNAYTEGLFPQLGLAGGDLYNALKYALEEIKSLLNRQDYPVNQSLLIDYLIFWGELYQHMMKPKIDDRAQAKKNVAEKLVDYLRNLPPKNSRLTTMAQLFNESREAQKVSANVAVAMLTKLTRVTAKAGITQHNRMHDWVNLIADLTVTGGSRAVKKQGELLKNRKRQDGFSDKHAMGKATTNNGVSAQAVSAIPVSPLGEHASVGGGSLTSPSAVPMRNKEIASSEDNPQPKVIRYVQQLKNAKELLVRYEDFAQLSSKQRVGILQAIYWFRQKCAHCDYAFFQNYMQNFNHADLNHLTEELKLTTFQGENGRVRTVIQKFIDERLYSFDGIVAPTTPLPEPKRGGESSRQLSRNFASTFASDNKNRKRSESHGSENGLALPL